MFLFAFALFIFTESKKNSKSSETRTRAADAPTRPTQSLRRSSSPTHTPTLAQGLQGSRRAGQFRALLCKSEPAGQMPARLISFPCSFRKFHNFHKLPELHLTRYSHVQISNTMSHAAIITSNSLQKKTQQMYKGSQEKSYYHDPIEIINLSNHPVELWAHNL